MVSTRSKGSSTKPTEAGDKRTAPVSSTDKPSKKQKTDTNAKLEVGNNGEVGLKKKEDQTDSKGESKESDDGNKEGAVKPGEDMDMTREEMKAQEGKKAEKGEDEVDQKALQGIKGELDEPKHGELKLRNVTVQG